MKFLASALLGVSLTVAQTANAVEVTGGSINLYYSGFTDETDVSNFGIEGSMEIGFTQAFSAQLDLSHNDFGATNIGVGGYGAHAIWHLDPATSFGAYYGREDFEGADLDNYGVEAGYETAAWEFEGYLGRLDDGGNKSTAFGVSGRYLFQNDLGLTGYYDDAGLGDEVDISRVGIKLDRDVAPNLNLFLEVGSGRLEASGASISEPYLGIGGKLVFGAERGATFEQRGLARILPGL